MDQNRTFNLSGIISKLTEAANKAVKSEEECHQFSSRTPKIDFQVPLNITNFEHGLRVS